MSDATTGLPDIAWRRADGELLSTADWQDHRQRALGVLVGQPGRSTQPVLLLVNAQHEDVDFALPPGTWQVLLDSTDDHVAERTLALGRRLLPAHGLALLQRLA